MRIDRESLLAGLPTGIVNQFRSFAITASVLPGEMCDIGMHHLTHQNPEKAASCLELVLRTTNAPPDVHNRTAAAILEAAQEVTNNPAQNIAPLAIKVLQVQSRKVDDKKNSADARCILAKYAPQTIKGLLYP